MKTKVGRMFQTNQEHCLWRSGEGVHGFILVSSLFLSPPLGISQETQIRKMEKAQALILIMFPLICSFAFFSLCDP